MRKMTGVIVAFLATWLASSSAFAWGAVVHRYVTRRAIDLLPPEIKPFFDHFRDELVLRSNDPDLWRVADFPEEPPNHQIDLGVDDYGAYPFSALPRDFGAAIETFGMQTLRRHGLLPWRTTEMYGNLRRAMAGFSRNQQYAEGNTVLFAAALAHYVQDAHQPQHVHNNYDGQLTRQDGLHSRFESELFERFESRLTISPGPVKPVRNARDFIFDIILDAYRQVPQILQADKEAIAGSDTYDQEYFERFLGNVKPLLERQLSRAITATASAIAAAWEQAGRPGLKTKVPRPVQKVKKP
jgi:hypothetical protein